MADASQNRTVQKRKVIVGVFGGNSVKSETLAAATSLGKAVALSGAVLLTGGQPKPRELGSQVKLAAIDGALQAGQLVPLVGVLPVTDPIKPDNRNLPDHQLLIPTNLTSAQRNPINSLTSDIVFALKGDAGTLAEIWFALAAGKRCYFVGSKDHLVKSLRENAEEVERNIQDGLSAYPFIKDKQANLADIVTRLSNVLQGKDDLSERDDMQKAVERALGKIDLALLQCESGFPGVLSREDFKKWLSRLP